MPDAQVNGFCGLNFIAFICRRYEATFLAILSVIALEE